MQREIQVFASTLAERFGAPLTAADAIGLIVVRHTADRLVAVYVPGARPRLTLAFGARADHPVAVALGHHMLRHRSQLAYPYTAAGALYDAPREEEEAAMFAREFLPRCRPNLVPFRARTPV
jgi:hypothetical protein